MRKGIILFFGVLLLIFGCTNSSKKKFESDQIAEFNFEIPIGKNSDHTKNIRKPTVIEIFSNDLDYNYYESKNAKQEYYNLTDFQGYYSEIIKPIIDSLKIERSSLSSKDGQYNFKTNNGENYLLDIGKIQSKQGLILFNGKSKPIFWKGDKSGELDAFIKDYFK